MSRMFPIVMFVALSCGDSNPLGPAMEAGDGKCRDQVHRISAAYTNYTCAHPDHTGAVETHSSKNGCSTKETQVLVCVCDR